LPLECLKVLLGVFARHFRPPWMTPPNRRRMKAMCSAREV